MSRESNRKRYDQAMRDLEQAMKWGSKEQIRQALEHAIRVDEETLKR